MASSTLGQRPSPRSRPPLDWPSERTGSETSRLARIISAVPLFRRHVSIAPEGPVLIRSERDRRALTKTLKRSLAALTARTDHPGLTVIEAQLVVQICGASSYIPWRQGIERAWRKHGGQYGTHGWPKTLTGEQIAAVLLPLPAGRVGLSAGPYPRLLASPKFTVGAAGERVLSDDPALSLIATWVSTPAPDVAARLAPPVIEVFQRGHIVERRIQTFGISWPLPAADGI